MVVGCAAVAILMPVLIWAQGWRRQCRPSSCRRKRLPCRSRRCHHCRRPRLSCLSPRAGSHRAILRLHTPRLCHLQRKWRPRSARRQRSSACSHPQTHRSSLRQQLPRSNRSSSLRCQQQRLQLYCPAPLQPRRSRRLSRRRRRLGSSRPVPVRRGTLLQGCRARQLPRSCQPCSAAPAQAGQGTQHWAPHLPRSSSPSRSAHPSAA
jgi:hypothetical protein